MNAPPSIGGGPSEVPQRLLERLDDLAVGFRERGNAIAVLGLGSVGRDLGRLDEHSDLDFSSLSTKGRRALPEARARLANVAPVVCFT
jgi:hypothetical protein